MWLTLLLSFLGVILKELLKKWLGGSQTEQASFSTYKHEFMGKFLARRNPAVAEKLFDHVSKSVAHVPVGTTLDLDLVLDKAKDKVKADLG